MEKFFFSACHNPRRNQLTSSAERKMLEQVLYYKMITTCT